MMRYAMLGACALLLATVGITATEAASYKVHEKVRPTTRTQHVTPTRASAADTTCM